MFLFYDFPANKNNNKIKEKFFLSGKFFSDVDWFGHGRVGACVCVCVCLLSFVARMFATYWTLSFVSAPLWPAVLFRPGSSFILRLFPLSCVSCYCLKGPIYAGLFPVDLQPYQTKCVLHFMWLGICFVVLQRSPGTHDFGAWFPEHVFGLYVCGWVGVHSRAMVARIISTRILVCLGISEPFGCGLRIPFYVFFF